MNGETRRQSISAHPHVWLGGGLFLLGMLNYLAPAFFDVLGAASRASLSIGPLPLMNAGAIGGVVTITLGIGLFTHGVDEVLRGRSDAQHGSSPDRATIETRE